MPAKRITDYPSRTPTYTQPTISVVTCVRNGVAGIARTIESVTAQGIADLEYIIVDGASTDGTQDVIRSYSDKITFWQSEPDEGISDGLNKGIALTTGRYIALIHSDDWLAPGQLERSVHTLGTSGADFVFGDLLMHDRFGPSHILRGDREYIRRIEHIMPTLNHPTVVVRREAYEVHGLFDTDYQLAMDYELLLRFYRAGLRGVYDSSIMGHMSLEGISDRNTLAALAEVRRASTQHSYPPHLANFRFGYRVFKNLVHRTLRHVAPATTRHLRRFVNPSYKFLE